MEGTIVSHYREGPRTEAEGVAGKGERRELRAAVPGTRPERLPALQLRPPSGWIAVIDRWVFWGPTPVHRDNHSIDFLFHKHQVSGARGRFWVEQFELLWQNFSHDYAAEQTYNEELIDS